MNLGDIIDRLAKRKVDLAAKQAEVKVIEDDISDIKQEFIAVATGVGVKEARTATHSATVKEVLFPQAVAWDQAYDFIHANKYYHLLQRRLSSPGCAELWDTGIEIPGVEKFRKIDVSLRGI